MRKFFKIILIVASVLVVIYLIVIGTTLIQMQSAFSRNEKKVANGIVRYKTIDQIQNFVKTNEYNKVKQINDVDSTLKYFQNYINSEK